MIFVINPGTGICARARLSWARSNLRRFLADLDVPGIEMRLVEDVDEQGYACFRLSRRTAKRVHRCVVHVPGIGIRRVRYSLSNRRDICAVQRLYVDGSSWAWPYALSVVADALAPRSRRSVELLDAVRER
jgi:hypothetical protein